MTAPLAPWLPCSLLRPFWRPLVGSRHRRCSRGPDRRGISSTARHSDRERVRKVPSAPVTKSGGHPRLCESGTIGDHTVASKNASIALRADLVSHAQGISRRARVTFASNDARVWRVTYISGDADVGDHIGVHGGLDARLGAASIRPANETCPTGAAHGDGERDRHRAAFERHPRNGSESPQPARMAGEARADRRWRLGGPGPARGTLDGNRVPLLPSVVSPSW